ncbi:hypothetical protein Y032_0017g3444 [Ancylostoma ceylanicum]|uniref:Uncharacterized protein n=1 Tax=Ancylostoma ceylanicum TaxID=53326 RepID=A0A016V7B3_9BILA|nr:hypothetical protein Y032_0017g3444 [Ancylostoma ceylanicum]
MRSLHNNSFLLHSTVFSAIGSSTEIRPIDKVLYTDANAVQSIIRQKRKSFFKKIRDGVKKTFKKIRIKKPQREFLKQALGQILIK